VQSYESKRNSNSTDLCDFNFRMLKTSISVATNQNFPAITRSAAHNQLFNLYSHFRLLADANDCIAVYSLIASGEPRYFANSRVPRLHRNTSEADKTIKPRELNWTVPPVREIHFLPSHVRKLRKLRLE